ncbi:30S ribosomal protein S4 [Deltaproteobacteria bacterium TL4]
MTKEANKLVFRHKTCRRLGLSVCGAVNCPIGRRPNPPGQHGANRRQKVTQYALQLLETQKLRAYYGISSKQARRYFTEALKARGQTNVLMVQTLETRLDSIVHRLGFSGSLRAARQMVVHRHFLVNGKNVNKPGIQVMPGDVIQLREKDQKVERYKEWFQFFVPNLPYLERDTANFSGRLIRLPERAEIPILVDDHLFVEYLAR